MPMGKSKKEMVYIILTGFIVGIISALLTLLGNPKNMGFCIACFLRDTAGGIGLHNAEAVRYIRPEITGIVTGALAAAVINKEFAPKGGSSPMTRFALGAMVMIGCLMFLGCPLRMMIRLAGGDLNALFGLLGFIPGILTGIFFLNRGYSLKKNTRLSYAEGGILPVCAVALLIIAAVRPSFMTFTEDGAGPGGMHASIAVSLAAGLIVGVLAQRTRLCFVGGIRDFMLFRDKKLLWGFAAVFAGCFIMNLVLTAFTQTAYFNPGLYNEPIAHTDMLWNFLGMYLAGFGCVLLGGCPLRHLVLSGEGNTDSAVTVLGLMAGAAISHNFKLASSAEGPTQNGRIAVIICIVLTALIAFLNSAQSKKAPASK